MGIKNNLEKLLAGILLSGALLFPRPAIAQQGPPDQTGQEQQEEVKGPKKSHHLNLGYNALELAIFNLGSRARLLDNISYSFGNLELGHSGLNEGNPSSFWYFGRNAFIGGKKGSKIKFAYVMKGNQEGIFYQKAGIRDLRLPHVLGADYGWVDFGVGKDAANATLFWGKGFLDGKIGLELYQDNEFPFKAKRSFYTEIQLYWNIQKHLSLSGRLEIPNFNPNQMGYGVMVVIHK